MRKFVNVDQFELWTQAFNAALKGAIARDGVWRDANLYVQRAKEIADASFDIMMDEFGKRYTPPPPPPKPQPTPVPGPGMPYTP
ncbi:MAG TPA: hypothetical protein VHD33_08280 [Legionellaceae bacterium]|nr:hypothetical protein [Legionellaceae bacterium]